MRLIDADALGVGKCSEKVLPHAYCLAWNSLIDLIEKAPTINALPAIYGRWIICSDGYYPYCSVCHNEPKSGIMTKFCPECGALMYESKMNDK